MRFSFLRLKMPFLLFAVQKTNWSTWMAVFFKRNHDKWVLVARPQAKTCMWIYGSNDLNSTKTQGETVPKTKKGNSLCVHLHNVVRAHINYIAAQLVKKYGNPKPHTENRIKLQRYINRCVFGCLCLIRFRKQSRWRGCPHARNVHTNRTAP